MKRDPVACLESWSDELLSRSQRVRKLIGDAHWLSDGFHKEELVREFLTRYLPSNLRVSRGFIVPADHELSVSGEIDVLITDPNVEPPWFCEGNLVIAPPSSVVGHLHVKTKFARDELSNVLTSGSVASHIVRSIGSSRNLWFGGIFFAPPDTLNPEHLKKLIRGAIKSSCGDAKSKLSPACFPDVLAVLEGPVFLFKKPAATTGEAPSILLKAYACPKLGPALFLHNLCETVLTSEYASREQWNRLLADGSFQTIFHEQFSLEQTDENHD